MLVDVIAASSELPRILTSAACVRLGISRAQVRTALRRGHWQRLAPGYVLTDRGEPTRLDWALVGLDAGGPRSALTGWDACRLHGVAGRVPPDPLILVLTDRSRSRSIGDVLVRRTDRPFAWQTEPDRSPLPHERVVAPARAVADTSLRLARLNDVRGLVAGVVQRSLATVDELVVELDEGPQQGSGLLRRALAEIGEGARSVAEVHAVHRLRTGAVPAFELNVPVVDASGRTVFVLDVLWRRLRAALEIDSREYHFAAADWQATMRRHNALTALGCALAHYPPSVVNRSGATWLREVETWLRHRARELGVPYMTGGGVLTSAPEPLVLRPAA